MSANTRNDFEENGRGIVKRLLVSRRLLNYSSSWAVVADIYFIGMRWCL